MVEFVVNDSILLLTLFFSPSLPLYIYPAHLRNKHMYTQPWLYICTINLIEYQQSFFFIIFIIIQ
jgi:hypothetical protein